MQVPSALAPSDCLQTLHPPAHPLLQHTPSTQLPERQADPEAQAWPSGFRGRQEAPPQ